MTGKNYSSGKADGPALWPQTPGTEPFWAVFNAYARSAEPIGRSAMKANLEMQSLIGCRAKAWTEIPATLQRCRTPVDLIQAQIAFWQEAGRNYADASRSVATAWQGVVPAVLGSADSGEAEERDYIKFSEPSAESRGDDRRHPGNGRRAA
jgi:hypothetical protein